MLQALTVILHVVVCLVLVLVVLLQTGKRADLAGAFGGGGSQTAFGARGAATALSKITTAAAVLFMITSLGLSLLSSRATRTGGTALDAVPAAQTVPAEQDQAPEERLPATTGDETTVPAEDGEDLLAAPETSDPGE
jgi:preprotein translocase subunit SecG